MGRPAHRRGRPLGTRYRGRRAAPPQRYLLPAPNRPDPAHQTPAPSLRTAELDSWLVPFVRRAAVFVSVQVRVVAADPHKYGCAFALVRPSSGPGARLYGVVDYPIFAGGRNLPGVLGALVRTRAGTWIIHPSTRRPTGNAPDRLDPTTPGRPPHHAASAIACCHCSERIVMPSETHRHRGKLHADAMRWRH